MKNLTNHLLLKIIKTLTLLFFLGCFQSVFSQENFSGIVTDVAGNPIVYANVVLLSAEDSTAVRGTITSEEGTFSFENVKPKSKLLKVSFIGYRTYLEKTDLLNTSNNLNVVLKENTSELAEVTIKAERPRIYQEVDRLIFNVENTSLSSGSTWEILKKAPGVFSIQGQLSIRNTPASIYINGRKVRLPAKDLKILLQSYAGENISQIEVITNPPASFDASSGPVLNIITSTNLTPGYKGSVFANYTQAVYPKYTLGTSHFYKTKKLDLFVNYSFNPRKEFKEDESYINFMNDQRAVFSKWRSDFNRTTRSSAHNLNAILDYTFNEKNALSFQATTLFSPNKTFDNNAVTRIYSAGGTLDSLYTTDSNLENDLHNIALDLGFQHQFEKKGTQLSATLHFTDYGKNRTQQVATNYFDPDMNLLRFNQFFTQAEQTTKIYAGKLDFETNFGSVDFTSGVKVTNIDSKSGLDFFDIENDVTSINSSLSDLFLYEETVFAGYVSFTKKWEKFNAKLGLRGEQTDREGTSVSMGETNERSYFELFPSVYLTYQIAKKHGLAFDYGRKIKRPKYKALNPFKYFINENNFNAGNPDLQAAISNEFSLKYTYKNAYSLNFYFKDNGPNVARLPFQDNQNLTLRSVYVNMEESKSYGIDFFHGRYINDWWYGQAYLSLFHEEETFLALESNNQLVTNETDGFYAGIYNGFTFSKAAGFSGNLHFTYMSSFIVGSYKYENRIELSFGLRKTLWNKRAEVSLHVADVLNRFSRPLSSNYLNQDNGYFAHTESRYIRIGFKYNFGNFRLDDNDRGSSTEERKRL